MIDVNVNGCRTAELVVVEKQHVQDPQYAKFRRNQTCQIRAFHSMRMKSVVMDAKLELLSCARGHLHLVNYRQGKSAWLTASLQRRTKCCWTSYCERE